MGAKASKKERRWQVEETHISFVCADEFRDEAAELERSTKTAKARNTLAPDDVFVLILRHLSVEDLAAVALVCRTWRRVSLRDAVWRPRARAMALELVDGASVRSQVVSALNMRCPPDLVWPPELRDISKELPLRAATAVRTVYVCLTNPSLDGCARCGMGKSAL